MIFVFIIFILQLFFHCSSLFFSCHHFRLSCFNPFALCLNTGTPSSKVAVLGSESWSWRTAVAASWPRTLSRGHIWAGTSTCTGCLELVPRHNWHRYGHSGLLLAGSFAFVGDKQLRASGTPTCSTCLLPNVKSCLDPWRTWFGACPWHCISCKASLACLFWSRRTWSNLAGLVLPPRRSRAPRRSYRLVSKWDNSPPSRCLSFPFGMLTSPCWL